MQIRKSELRKKYKSLRVSDAVKDKLIFEKLISLKEYKTAETVFCYASYKSEVSTNDIINHSLKEGKRVALPVIIDKAGNMDFYFIDSLSDFDINEYGIPEPNKDSCEKATADEYTLLIVPALCFNRNGFRLGYGGGYYDRFLTGFNGTSVGLCYGNCICDDIPVESYDIPVNIVINENEIIYCNNGGKNG